MEVHNRLPDSPRSKTMTSLHQPVRKPLSSMLRTYAARLVFQSSVFGARVSPRQVDSPLPLTATEQLRCTADRVGSLRHVAAGTFVRPRKPISEKAEKEEQDGCLLQLWCFEVGPMCLMRAEFQVLYRGGGGSAC